ncbi:hypothetical protein SASPL_122726 [Salvia splendens]|uniref:glutathione transferase n=1 Tax=Salvia splendens TaxID=180675 RepID=A0A8X8ZSJ1_SALSN|nr:hypothetical protein SASPL_122726 [Salvia splendens]
MAIIGVWLEVEAQKFNVAAQPLSYELYLKPIMGRTTDDAVVEERQAELAAVLDIYEARLGKSRKVYDISTYALVIVVHLYTYDICTYAFLVHMRPFGQIPAFQDGDLNLFGWFEPVYITSFYAESRAITRYIAHSYAGKGAPLVSSDAKKAAVEGVWAEVEAQRYEPPAAKLTWELGIKPILGMATDDDVVKAQETELEKVLDVYEPRLAHSKYLGGDAFSLADLHHLPTLKYLMASPVKAVFEARPHVAAWVAEIMARPSWQKVLAEC